MSERWCRFCLAAWGDIGSECEHGDREAGVARQIAARIHEQEPTDEQVGWFMEDAELICAIVKDAAPVIRRWEPKTMRLYVGAAAFRVADEGGLVLASPSEGDGS